MSGFESAWRMEPICKEKNISFWCIEHEGDHNNNFIIKTSNH